MKKPPLKAKPIVVPRRLAPLKQGDEVSVKYEGGKWRVKRVKRARRA